MSVTMQVSLYLTLQYELYTFKLKLNTSYTWIGLGKLSFKLTFFYCFTCSLVRSSNFFRHILTEKKRIMPCLRGDCKLLYYFHAIIQSCKEY